MFRVEITLAGAVQFSDATPVVTFAEELPTVAAFPSNQAPLILGYAYSALGDPHTVDLRLVRAAGDPANFSIPLEVPGSNVTSFEVLCGPEGIAVPAPQRLRSDGAAARRG